MTPPPVDVDLKAAGSAIISTSQSNTCVSSSVQAGLVAQIIPTSDPGRPSLDPFNAAIPALVSSKNTARSPVRVVDQNSGFNATVDTYDGVHPDLSGEIKMANKWYNALVPLLTN